MVLPNKSGTDELVFLEESAPRSVAESTRKPEVWRVLIIDDDEDVHTATVFALNNLEMQHRPLEFLHAYSAAEARRLLQNETDILACLDDGTLGAASLDVFADEPLPADSPFWTHPKIVLTPHNAADTDPDEISKYVARQIERLEAGGALENVVDPARGY